MGKWFTVYLKNTSVAIKGENNLQAFLQNRNDVVKVEELRG